jgi:hypothetical protein
MGKAWRSKAAVAATDQSHRRSHRRRSATALTGALKETSNRKAWSVQMSREDKKAAIGPGDAKAVNRRNVLLAHLPSLPLPH